MNKVNKKRSKLIAVLSTILFPGLGHMYAGRLKNGLIFSIFPLLFVVFLSWTGIIFYFTGFLFALVSIVLYLIIALVHITIVIRKYSYFSLKRYNRWYYYLFYVLAIGTVSFYVTENRESLTGYMSYHVLAGGMGPAIQPGDYIVVDAKYRKPVIGDVIVFLELKTRKIRYVKRVAALGGDTIKIENGGVFTNGQFNEKLKVDREKRRRPYSRSMKERLIAKNHVFVIGDFRDNSNDSRFFGSIPIEDIRGKVKYIWYSNNTARIGQTVR